MCEPRAYVPEQDPGFAEQCKQFNRLRKQALRRGKAPSRRLSPADDDLSWKMPPRMSDE